MSAYMAIYTATSTENEMNTLNENEIMLQPQMGQVVDEANQYNSNHQRHCYQGYGHSASQSGHNEISGLKKSENAWKPSKPHGANATEEEQTEEILRNVRSILNKLTPQKFSLLMQKFQLLAINSEARHRGVINLIFEKMNQITVRLMQICITLCRTMSQMRVPAPAFGVQNAAQPSTTVEFRKILLTRCQRKFEKDRTNEDAFGEIRKKLENASTPEEKQQFKEELEYAETKERRRMLGNIRFIGELFKLNMLTESIMHYCIMSLFKGRDEESLVSLCQLLTTIGQSLDHVKGKARMDQYFQQIEKIIREKKTSARVRFMLQYVVDLRQNHWTPIKPKLHPPQIIDKIRADAIKSTANWFRLADESFNNQQSNKVVESKKLGEIDVIMKRFKTIVSDYLLCGDIKQATKSFTAIKSRPTYGHLFVEVILKASLEKSFSSRKNVALLLCNFVKTRLILPEQYIEGVVSIMELATDLELDLPKIWICIAEQVVPMFCSLGTIRLSRLTDLAEPLLKEGKAAIFAAEVIKLLIKRKTFNAALQLWKLSNLRMEYFLKSDDPFVIMEFLKLHGLEVFCTNESAAEKSVLNINFSFKRCASDLLKQIDMDKSNNEIIDWIEANINAENKALATFVRALTTAVSQKAIQDYGEMEFNNNLIKHRSILLKKFIDTDAKELQAVYALQNLWVDLKEPPNVLNTLFEYFFDKSIIHKESFVKWEKSTDRNEIDGKDKAVICAKPFFTWLRELGKSENARKPSKIEIKLQGTNATEEEQSEEILRNVRSILNELIPQNFSQLMQKFQLLAINSEARLRGVIDLIFEKAIDEPHFCEAYANMCRTMSQMRVAATASGVQNAVQPSTTVEFRKILLTLCQREFEKDRTNEDVLGEIRKKLENASTHEEKQQFKEELEYAETKECYRMLGNIRFIGELFKLNMLTESIMHNCIMSLFKGRDEESLESLCRLLTTIGQSLDHVKGKARMDQYLQQIEKIIREKKTSARVRFMLQDVVDLRQNDWKPIKPKFHPPQIIDKIRADAIGSIDNWFCLTDEFFNINKVVKSKQLGERDVIMKRFKTIVSDYLLCGDIKHATKSFTAIKARPTYGHLFLKAILKASLEKSFSSRENVALLLCHFVKNRLILPEQYINGVVSIMELATDLELDLPKIWICIAEQVVPMFCSLGTIRLSRLTDLAEPLLKEGKAAIFAAEVIKLLIKRKTFNAALQLWKLSNLRMEYFLKSDDPFVIMEFLKLHGLEVFCTNESAAEKSVLNINFSFKRCASDLLKQIDMDKSNNEIIDWIEANINAENKALATFVRALTTAVSQKAIQDDGEMEVNNNLIKRRSILLKKFIDTDAKELQAVYALQKLWVDLKEPPNVLNTLFEYFFDKSIIHKESFVKWEQSTDRNEIDGKDKAVICAKPFFTWLRGGESDE